MKKQEIKILAIETSCDETAAAVITGCHSELVSESKGSRNPSASLRAGEFGMTGGNHPVVLSNVVSSQVDLHAKTGGVVPEVASREHMEAMIPVVQEALAFANRKSQIANRLSTSLEAGKQISNSKSQNNNLTIQQFNNDELSSITHIAVTAGPGLVGSLLVGFNTAKAMAYALDIPIVPINHIEGHIYSAMSGEISKSKSQITNKLQSASWTSMNSVESRTNSKSEKNNLAIQQFSNELKFPILALTVSGGHTSLTLMLDHGRYQTIGQTRDDAAGEAFDKVAKLLNLGYPGGPAVSKLADEFRNKLQITPLRSESSEGQANYKLQTNPKSEIRNPKQISNSKSQKTKNLQPNSYNLVLPRPMINDKSFDFSFSGLKTAVLEVVRKIENQNVIATRDQAEKQSDVCVIPAKAGIHNRLPRLEKTQQLAMTEVLSQEQKSEICVAFEDAVVDVLCTKTLRAAERYRPKSVILAGGVAANKRLREELASRLQNHKTPHFAQRAPRGRQNTNHLSTSLEAGKQNPNSKSENNSLTIQQFNNLTLLVPPIKLCGDNAAMIGLAAYYHIIRGDAKSWDEIKVDSNLKL